MSALPAADFDLVLDCPSRKVVDAFFAVADDVARRGAPRCERALPAALFDFGELARFLRVLDVFDAAFLPVTFDTIHPRR